SLYCQRDDESVRHYESIPHPLHSKILDGSAQALSHCAGFNNLRISMMQPNNVVMFVDEGVKLYGLIKQMYRTENPSGGTEDWVKLVEMYARFHKPENFNTPSLRFCKYLSQMRLVVDKLSPPVIGYIKAERIQATCAYHTLPQDTFGLTSCKSIILQVVGRHYFFFLSTHSISFVFHLLSFLHLFMILIFVGVI
ncbi:hypothetical protein PSTT_05718, partial [Puccinia striiformis]